MMYLAWCSPYNHTLFKLSKLSLEEATLSKLHIEEIDIDK